MYHAGMSQAARKNSHKAFLSDEVKVVVATVAFGMGINKPNVRMVLHWGAPSDMEAYYQQVISQCVSRWFACALRFLNRQWMMMIDRIDDLEICSRYLFLKHYMFLPCSPGHLI